MYIAGGGPSFSHDTVNRFRYAKKAAYRIMVSRFFFDMNGTVQTKKNEKNESLFL